MTALSVASGEYVAVGDPADGTEDIRRLVVFSLNVLVVVPACAWLLGALRNWADASWRLGLDGAAFAAALYPRAYTRCSCSRWSRAGGGSLPCPRATAGTGPWVGPGCGDARHGSRLFDRACFGIRADTANDFGQRVRPFAVTENHFVTMPNKMFGVRLSYISCPNEPEFHMRFLFFYCFSYYKSIH